MTWLARVSIMLVGVLVAGLVLAGCCRCRGGALRGDVEGSPDGKTRLIIDDDNGGQACARVLVDGKPWPHGFHAAGEIEPGIHTLDCGGAVEIEVGRATTFRFNYWGP